VTDGDRSTDVGLTLPRSPATLIAVPRLLFTVMREGGNDVQRQLEIDGERVRIGSHPSNELVLDDRLVSRFHCTLTREPTCWAVKDAESLNGTFLGGVRVRDAILPGSECELRLGDSWLRVTPVRARAVVQVPEQSQFGELFGNSIVMRQVFALLERVAASDATVLIEGESGTGKELAAAEIVRRGARAQRRFLTLDCGAISPSLMESELFGHARGAFTGADRARVGAFEGAHGGTLFLDEIGELPLEMQPKLLRALEAREIRRVGENDTRKVDVRVIAATNRDLEREVNRGRFREDLYFRLSVIRVRLPPLRERLEDIPCLVQAFLERMEASSAEPLFTREVYRELKAHDWPGNVRELRNYVERALVLETADPASVPSARDGQRASRSDDDGNSAPASDVEQPFKVAKERVIVEFEKVYLERLMQWAQGNVSRAARKAKIDRMYLHRLLQRYAMTRDSQPDR